MQVIIPKGISIVLGSTEFIFSKELKKFSKKVIFIECSISIFEFPSSYTKNAFAFFLKICAGGENRTLVLWLEARYSTTKLRPHIYSFDVSYLTKLTQTILAKGRQNARKKRQRRFFL